MWRHRSQRSALALAKVQGQGLRSQVVAVAVEHGKAVRVGDFELLGEANLNEELAAVLVHWQCALLCLQLQVAFGRVTATVAIKRLGVHYLLHQLEHMRVSVE